MIAAPLPVHSPPRWAATDAVGEVPPTTPLQSDRFKYKNPQQRQRPQFHPKRPEKDKRKPDEAHKVDDYA